jgi:hypothetical protein
VNFLALTPRASYALLACVALVIVLMYWLKPRPLRVKVASNRAWRALARSRQPVVDRWRWWLSLLLALATGLSIALALTGPQVSALGGIARRVVLVMDDSPSMLARGQDGIRRWDHAVERARRIVSSSGLGGQVMVLDTLGRTDTPEWVAPEAALATLRQLAPGTSGIARMPILPNGEHVQAYLLTDGVARLDVPERMALESVFTPTDNVAITAFDAKPSLRDPMHYQALIQVFNASLSQQRVLLKLTGANQFSIERDLDIPAGSSINQTVDVTDYPAGVLRAEVRGSSDRFGLDNVAYAVVAPHRARRVLLVTAGNRYLERSLGRLPGIALTVVKPSQYHVSSRYDVNVFDRFAPPQAPEQGALLFRPPPAIWLPEVARTTRNPVITRWHASHPLAANVPWRSVHIERATLAKRSTRDTQTDVVLASNGDEAVLIAAGGAGSRWIAVGFALDDSNFAMQSAFPVFLGSALSWLTEGAATLSRGLGSVEIALAGAKVTGPDGNAVAAVSIPGATIFDAARPGVFTVANETSAIRVVANVTDPQFSDVNRSRFAGAAGAGAPTVSRARLNFEPWVLLLLFAVALLALEWLAYVRHRTV